MRLKAILFDVDGTLAETEEAHRTAFNRAFAEAGFDGYWSEDAYRALLTTTGGRERIARYRAEQGQPADPARVAALHRRKNALYADLVASGAVVPRPGVMALIEEARRRGVALGIATTTSRSNLAALLHHVFEADAAAWFAAIVTGEDVAVKKPDPEVYHRALAALSLSAIDCVAIEDSRNGLIAAAACGIATIITPSRYTSGESFHEAVLTCDTLAGPVDIDRLESLLAIRRTP